MHKLQLFKIFGGHEGTDLTRYTTYFGKENILRIKDNLIGIKYEYDTEDDYKSLLDKTPDSNLKQLKLDCEDFARLIKYLSINNYYIKEVQFANKMPQNEKEHIAMMLFKLNHTTDLGERKKMANKLCLELKWHSNHRNKTINKLITTSRKDYHELVVLQNGVVLTEDLNSLNNLKIA